MSPEGARRPPCMARVIANMSMSLDGFIADPDDGCDDLFGWYEAGRSRYRTRQRGARRT